MPHFIDVILANGATLVIGRIVLSSFFLIAGLYGVFNFGAVVREMQAVSLPTPQLFAFATITVQLGGSILLISNVGGLAWLGAGGLAVFTLACIPIGHAFWTFPEPQRQAELQIALEHVALTGGLLLAAIASR